MSENYTDSEKKQLLELARKSIESMLTNQAEPDISDFPENLKQKRSCFVTLHTNTGGLRGCIGNIGAFEALDLNILHNARNAAFNDPRFPSVGSVHELNQLTIEISVLTPPEAIDTPDEFIVGEHGITMQLHGRSSVFLPQVAPEQGWDAETTLTHLSMKAGLPADSWKNPETAFSVFKAIVFSEDDF